jgi:hypothetical protein
VFELLSATKTKIVDVVVLSQKNRQPDDNPGVKISVEQALTNMALAHFDGGLRAMLYSKKPGAAAAPQRDLEGVEPISDTPHLTPIGQRLGWFHWDWEGSGYTLAIDHGMGGKSALELADCTVSNLRLHCNEGGTVDARYDIESADASEKAFGRLAKLKSTEVEILLRAPEVAQDDIERPRAPVPAPKAAAAAAVPKPAEKTPEQALAESLPKNGAGKPVKDWPFPTTPPDDAPPAAGKTSRRGGGARAH